MPSDLWHSNVPTIEIDQRSREQRLRLEELERWLLPYLGNREPPLNELLDDPITHLLMASDGVPPREVRAHINIVRWRLRERVE
jgi:hypothetical protein